MYLGTLVVALSAAALCCGEMIPNWQQAAHTLTREGVALRERGAFDEADQKLSQALAQYREHADRANVARALNNLAALRQSQQQLTEAERLYRESIETAALDADADLYLTATSNLA